jgi:protease-4
MKQFLKYTFATIVGLFISFLFLGVLLFFTIMSLVDSKGQQTISVKDNSVLELHVDYDVPERTNTNMDLSTLLMRDNDIQFLGLDKILESIKTAKDDKKIKGIYLKTNINGTGYATMLEIRNALADFKKSGKFIYTLATYYDEKNYYLASVADSIFIERSGNVMFNGLTANVMFLKGALEKMGIDMQYVKVGTYKGAIEAFTRKDLSDENRQQISEYVHDLYYTIVETIGESRGIDTGKIDRAFSDFTIQSPADAVAFGLIDRLTYADEVVSSMKNRLKVKKDKDLNLVKADKYSNQEKESKDSKDKIAIVYAVGEIIDGEGNQSTIGSISMAKAIASARDDKNVKAIVLRVNSPGGSSIASDIIAREIALCKGIKPVVVSMSDVAASGGYYISAFADSIIALPNTITGSIGVFGLFPNMHELLTEKLGLTFESVKTGKYSDFARVDRPLNETDRMYLQNMVNRIYDDFTNVVEQGRGLDSIFVEGIAQGRVWTAKQALDKKLIDSYGGINDAIGIAAFMSKTKTYNTVVYPKIENTFSQFLKSTTSSMMESKLESDMGIFYTYYKALQSSVQAQGFQMRLPFEINIQ